MWSRSSPSSSARAGLGGLLATALACASPSTARAQACCAGGAAITPGRLALHEDALVGVQLKAATVLGQWDAGGHYLPEAAGETEGDFEEDLFGAVRVLRRGQVALLVPLVETQRQNYSNGGAFGGGIGDVNVSGRYDFVLAGESRYVPGVALLAGVTFPTGKPPEYATQTNQVDATGIGAFQANGAVALEQTFGNWLVDASGILAIRTPRFGEQLAPQGTLLAAVAYTFPSDYALALSASYTFEGDARYSDGTTVASSSRRATLVSLSGYVPLGDTWRLLGGVYLDPPVNALGSNQPVAGGLTLTVIRSWT